jgi:hypothetical protein
MEDLEDPDPREERISHVEKRLRAAVLRMSQAQEHPAVALERLAHACRTLRDSQAEVASGQAMPTERGEQPGDNA